MKIPCIFKRKYKITDARLDAEKLFHSIYKTIEDDIIDNTLQDRFIQTQFKECEYKLWDNYILSQHCNSIKKINVYKINMQHVLDHWTWFRSVPESQYNSIFKSNMSSYYGYMKEVK